MSLFGLVPLGVYVFVHLSTNMTSLDGPQAFNAALEASRANPALIFLEVFGLGLPLLVHLVVGFAEIWRGRPNVARYAFFDNFKYALQRLSAIGLALFIGAHVWKARLFPEAEYAKNGHESWLGMHHGLSEPITFTVYCLGMLGVSYHLANGLQTAAMRWGVVVSDKGRARMQIVSYLVLVALLVMAGMAIYGFRPFQPEFDHLAQ